MGGYHPEIHGGGKQQELIIKNLSDKYNFNVISFSTKFDSPFTLNLKKIFRIKIKKNNILNILPLIKLTIYFIFNQSEIDLIHLRGNSKKNILLILLSKFFSKKIIYTPTRYLEDDLYTIKKNNKFLYFLYKKIQFLHCISPIFFSGKNKIIKKNFKYSYIPNIVDTNLFNFKKRKKKNNLTILCVGFFSKIKNQKILYKSWKRISKKIKCKLHFVGMKNMNYYLANNEELKYILDDAKKEKLLNLITFSDNVKNMADIYKSADVFVLPSLTEGMPNALLEAMSTGLPSITSNLKFITTPIIKNGVNGFLFNHKNSYQLDKYLLSLLSSKKLRHKTGVKARHYILQNHSRKLFLQHKLMYEKLLS